MSPLKCGFEEKTINLGKRRGDKFVPPRNRKERALDTIKSSGQSSLVREVLRQNESARWDDQSSSPDFLRSFRNWLRSSFASAAALVMFPLANAR